MLRPQSGRNDECKRGGEELRSLAADSSTGSTSSPQAGSPQEAVVLLLRSKGIREMWTLKLGHQVTRSPGHKKNEIS